MKSLFEYEFLVNEVFYKCYHILEWIKLNPNMSDLDRKAVQATIMDALVYKKLIDPSKESLDLEHLCIVNNLDYYVYEQHPDVCGIPQWMKEEFRKKMLGITGGIPISMFLAKPPSKITRYCVFDPNTAVSAIFSDATFYNVLYNSPTRNVKLKEARPFVEVEIESELYLVDTLTKRIFKSRFFKENYGFEVLHEKRVSSLDEEDKKIYEEQIAEYRGLSTFILFALFIQSGTMPPFAEMKFELEKSKEYFPEEWEKYEQFKIEMERLP